MARYLLLFLLLTNFLASRAQNGAQNASLNGGTLQGVMSKGNKTDTLYIFDQEKPSAPGSPAGTYVWQYLPLDRTYGNVPYSFGLGATAYTGVGIRDNVMHEGWNLNYGGGPIIGGKPFFGRSTEYMYIPSPGDTIAGEIHTFLGDFQGRQIRGESYTARKNPEGTLNIDHYHAVARSYLKHPYTDRVYFSTEPSSTGASSSWALSETNNFSLLYDSDKGVIANLAGKTSNGDPTWNFQNFNTVIMPTMTVSNEIIVADKATLRATTTNTTQLGDAERRWSTVWGYDGDYSNILRGVRVVAGNNGEVVFSGAKLSVATNINNNTYASIDNSNGGTTALSSLYFSQDNNNYAGIEHFNAGYSGNYSGTSLPLANSTSLGGATTATGGNYYGSAFTYRTLANVALHSTSGTSIGYRSDAVGFRVGQIQNLHSTNTAAWQVDGSVKINLSNDANYDIYYRNNNGALTRLPAGTDGYVLTTHSTSSAPTWEAAARTLKETTNWTPGVVAAGSSASTTVNVTGAAVGDPVTVSKKTGYTNGEVYDAFVSAPNTVTIRVHNVSTASANYSTAADFNVIVHKY
ncbi:hypothetical protein [Longitalea arenae]|uniref:hypothetical protein n=1 Tax=Longitalea arenae TaxID=2812558 RepID=UPI0019680D32|nr:hypothetical protein [Longitalea arenae]